MNISPEQLAQVEAAQRNRGALEEKVVKAFIMMYQIGYGRLMQISQKLWREKLIADGMSPGGEFAYGPCVAMTVPCGCRIQSQCAWCCGSGWLTQRVKAAKEAAGE